VHFAIALAGSTPEAEHVDKDRACSPFSSRRQRRRRSARHDVTNGCPEGALLPGRVASGARPHRIHAPFRQLVQSEHERRHPSTRRIAQNPQVPVAEGVCAAALQYGFGVYQNAEEEDTQIGVFDYSCLNVL